MNSNWLSVHEILVNLIIVQYYNLDYCRSSAGQKSSSETPATTNSENFRPLEKGKTDAESVVPSHVK